MDNILMALILFGDDWPKSVTLLEQACAEQSAHTVWRRICSLIISAEVFRTVPNYFSVEAKPFADKFAERTGLAAEWVLDRGKKMSVDSFEELIVSLSRLRRHLGLAAKMTNGVGTIMGAPKRFKSIEKQTYGGNGNPQDEIEERFRKLRGPQ